MKHLQEDVLSDNLILIVAINKVLAKRTVEWKFIIENKGLKVDTAKMKVTYGVTKTDCIQKKDSVVLTVRKETTVTQFCAKAGRNGSIIREIVV